MIYWAHVSSKRNPNYYPYDLKKFKEELEKNKKPKLKPVSVPLPEVAMEVLEQEGVLLALLTMLTVAGSIAERAWGYATGHFIVPKRILDEFRNSFWKQFDEYNC